MKIGEFEILKKHAGARVSIILKTTITLPRLQTRLPFILN
jgi:hypothetical protein